MNDIQMSPALAREPEWYTRFFDKWYNGDANVFILHHNIKDFVNGFDNPSEYLLMQAPITTLPIVIYYDIGSGISFPNSTHYKRFRQLLGLSENDYGPKGEDLPKDPVTALNMISQLLLMYRDENLNFGEPGNDSEKKSPEEDASEEHDGRKPLVAVIIKHAELLVPNSPVSQLGPEEKIALAIIHNWAQNRLISDYGNPAILLAENISNIHESLRSVSSRVVCIEIPNPTVDMVQAYMELKAHDLELEVAIEPRRIPHLTAALGLVHIEDIFYRAEAEGKEVTAELFSGYKDEIMAAEFDGVLEIIEPGAREQKLGGMKAVRKVLMKNIAEPMLAGDLKLVPMGVILMGPPGCGKTALMMSIAAKVGLPVVNFNINKVFDKYVGESETKLERALKTIDSIGQCIVLMDEISESGIGRQDSGDSGVSTRVFRRILEFTSDPKHRGKIVFVGMTNRPDLIDPALFRDGRLGDKKIPVLAPDEEEREDIIKVILDDMDIRHNIDDFNDIVKRSENYTGANLNKLVRTAIEITIEDKRDIVTGQDFIAALDCYRPMVTHEVQRMIDLAIKFCDDKRLLPDKYHQAWLMQRASDVKDTGEEEPVTIMRRRRRGPVK